MRHYTTPYYVTNEQGHVRVKVVSVAGKEVLPGIVGADPDVAKPHFEKFGWCDEEAVPFPENPTYTNPKITLDDGNTLWGFECWWTPVRTPFGELREAEIKSVLQNSREFNEELRSVKEIYDKYRELEKELENA